MKNMDATKCSEDFAQNLLRIDQLELSNYRCFTQCTVDFHPTLTVLVAENAKGKSAILDAIAVAIDPIIANIIGRQSIGFPLGAIHLSKNEHGKMKLLTPARIQAKGSVANRDSVNWARELVGSSKRSRPSSRELKDVVSASGQFTESLESGNSSILPVVAYYRTDRLWTSQDDRSSQKGTFELTGRFVGYQNWSSPTSSFGSFVDWYRSAFTDLGASTSKFRDKDDRLEKQLAAIHDAISTALEPTGWRSIIWQGQKSNDEDQVFEEECIAVEHSTKGVLPLQFLSDGVKNMISLVADLSYRCVRLNPELGMDASSGTPGVVLIDEIDMHLHPRWQQVVVDLLTRAFPRVQFIVTTHSPQVLSTVDYQSIRLVRLEGSKAVVRKPEYQTRGIESADILARLMDVDPIPHVQESQWLSDYRALLQTARHETKDGVALWEKIVDHFGENNPVLDEFETLRRFQVFRRTQGLNEKAGSSDAEN